MNRAAQFILHGSGPLRTTPGQQVSVLVVEDNPGDANLIRERLTEAPYARFDVAMVPTLAAARVALPRLRPDVLVIDLQLPDSEGLSTLDALVDQAPAAVKLVVTGSVDSETRTRAIDRGADDILGKEDLRTQLFSRSLLHLMERRRADAAFRELTGMLDATPDAILVVGHDGVVRYVNEVALTLFDRRREDFIGELLGFSVSAGDPVHIEIHARGERRQCELRVAPLQWDQHPAWLATLRDITERRKMEAQVAFADRMVSIGTLAAGWGTRSTTR